MREKPSQLSTVQFPMKLKLAILALALLIPIAARADEAAQTRARYAAVDKAVPKATVIKRELQGYSLEGGELTAYFQKGVPLKMVAKHYGETGRAINEYYFWQGRLFFIVQTTQRYNAPLGTKNEADKFKFAGQERFYFKNGAMWLWINSTGKTIKPAKDRTGFEDTQTYHLMIAREMLAGARKTDKTIIAPR